MHPAALNMDNVVLEHIAWEAAILDPPFPWIPVRPNPFARAKPIISTVWMGSPRKPSISEIHLQQTGL